MLIGVSGPAGSGKDAVADFLRADLRFTSISLADPLKRICRDVYDFTEEQLWGPSAMRNKPDERYPRPNHTWGLPQRIEPQGYIASCACCGLTSEPMERFDDILTAKLRQCYLTPRYCLQKLGTEWGRDCYPDTWSLFCVRTAQVLLKDQTLQYDRKRGLYARVDSAVIEGVAVPDVRFRNELRVIREAGGKVIRVKRPGAGLQGTQGLHASEAEQLQIQDDEFDGVINNVGTLEELRAMAYALATQLGATP